MKLTCFNKSKGEYVRGLQLINKTNQFNMNGLRIDEREFQEVISSGGMLLTGELSDNSGTHGEVVAMLVKTDGEVVSFVMSCRVFDRKLEFVFLLSALKHLSQDLTFKFEKTERNDPFNRFYSSVSNCIENGTLDNKLFQRKYRHLDNLIESNNLFPM